MYLTFGEGKKGQKSLDNTDQQYIRKSHMEHFKTEISNKTKPLIIIWRPLYIIFTLLANFIYFMLGQTLLVCIHLYEGYLS